MRAIKSWLSLLAVVVALIVANPGFASAVGASGHHGVTAAGPSHCANMLGDHKPVGGNPASACEHCLLCGVAFIAPFESPRIARPIAARLRPTPPTVEQTSRPQEHASANRARAPPLA